MTRYLLGVVLAAVAIVPIGLGTRAVRRALLPGWQGLEAWLAGLVLGLVAVTVVAQALGTVGLFATAPVVIVLAVVGGLAAVLVPRRFPADAAGVASSDEASDRAIGSEPDDPVSAPDRPDEAGVDETVDAPDTFGGSAVERGSSTERWQTVVAGIVLLPLLGSWTTRTLQGIDDGMTTVDTIWYHLTVAARFVQTGRTGSIQFIDSDPVTAYFPASSSLLHGVGMLLFDSDLVSTLVNLGWLVVALAAAWMIGRPFGVAPLSMVGAGLLFAGPGMVATQPGGVLNDVAGVALLLVAVAIVVRDRGADRTVGQDLVAALAAGMAMGFKFTFIVPALAVGVALVLTAPRRARVRRALVVACAMFVAGGYWYVRNLVATGNPLPSLDVSLGPISLPLVESNVPTNRFAAYAFDADAWERYLLNGLGDALGPAWFAVLAFVLIGIVGGIFHPSVRARTVAVLAAVNLAAYAVSPQYLEVETATGELIPTFFATNLRYAAPGLVLGLVLFPIVLRRWSWPALAAMGVTMVATQMDRVSWPSPLEQPSFFYDPKAGGMTADLALRGVAAVAAVIVGAAVVAAAARQWPSVRRLVERGWLLVPVLVVVALAVVHDDYRQDRYTNYGALTGSYRWAAGIEGARIGTTGGVLQLQYPYTGPEWDNHVQYIGVEDGDGGFRPAKTCAEWVELLEEGRYDNVVLMTPDAVAWTLTQRDAKVVRRDPIGPGSPLAVTVFALDASRDRRRCPR